MKQFGLTSELQTSRRDKERVSWSL